MRLTRRQLRKLIKEVFLSDPASSALTDMSHAGRLRHVDDLGEELGQMARSDVPEDYRQAGDLYASVSGDIEGGKTISGGPVPGPPPGSFSPSSREAQELKAKLRRLNQAQKDLIPPRGSNFDNWAEDSKARRRAKQKAVRDRQWRVQRTMRRLGLPDLEPTEEEKKRSRRHWSNR